MEELSKIIAKNIDNVFSASFILVLTYVSGFAMTRILRGSLIVTEKIKGKKSVEIEAAQLTKLKMVKRLILLGIYFVGISAALYQFAPFQKLGTALLASAGVVGVVGGMAARASLANILSGMVIAFAQPIRIGDKITVDEDSGVVKEITLLYTILKADDGLVIIPNSVLSEATIKNHSVKK